METSWSYYLVVVLTVAYILLLVGEICRLILENRNPVRTWAWIVVIIALPFIGIFLFYHIGLNYRKRKMFSRKGLTDLRWLELMSEDQRELLMSHKILKEGVSSSERKLITLLLRNSKSLLTTHNDIEIFNNGQDAFEAIFDAIQRAEHFIHLEFYIVEDGELAKRLKFALLAKLKEGVEVRFIYDAFGSRKLPDAYFSEMREAGAEIYPFLPIRVARRKSNYRNHRKIVVVDGVSAFLGGVNVADRYIYGSEIGAWRDTLLKVGGEAVTSIQLIYLVDWYFVSQQVLFNERNYFPPPAPSSSTLAQVIASGPDSDWDSIRQAYMTMISMAEEHVYISTPYFMPGDVMINAIKCAAMGGVDVRLLLPYRSDSRLTYWCSRSYITELLTAGVRLYLYKPGINHSKVISIDGRVAAIGSANVDLRSLEQNFEVSMIIYDKGVVERVERDFEKDLEVSEEISLESWNKRKYSEQIRESICRLFAPLL